MSISPENLVTLQLCLLESIFQGYHKCRSLIKWKVIDIKDHFIILFAEITTLQLLIPSSE